LGELLSDAELETVHNTVEIWRSRLTSISWFMSCLNHHIAVQANKEDGCTGRFWEGRFESQGLVDVAALLSCMAYVDLNPIRAGIADNLEESDFTSIQDRIFEIQNKRDNNKPQLMAFAESETASRQEACLPYSLRDYLDLVDGTGRVVRNDKKGYIKSNEARLLSRLGISESQWQILTLEIQKKSITMLHGLNKLAVMEKRSNTSKVA
jgi:putative transposase